METNTNKKCCNDLSKVFWKIDSFVPEELMLSVTLLIVKALATRCPIVIY